MRFDVRESTDVTIMDLEGRFVMGSDESDLREKIEQLVHYGHRRFILNLSAVETMDSTGLGELLAIKRLLDGVEGQLRLLRVTGRVHHTLQLTLLLPLFEVHESEENAIASFTR